MVGWCGRQVLLKAYETGHLKREGLDALTACVICGLENDGVFAHIQILRPPRQCGRAVAVVGQREPKRGGRCGSGATNVCLGGTKSVDPTGTAKPPWLSAPLPASAQT